jgi:uncharacterized cysteine cluster protein YcgN (CxxCxxCC family)
MAKGPVLKSEPGKPVDEALCTHCGKCCYKKLIIGRSVYITPFPCDYLDTKTNLCTIYKERHEKNPECLSIYIGMRVNAFPAECPYVPEHAPVGFKPAREDFDWQREFEEFDDIADDLGVSDRTREYVRARGPDAPPEYVETNFRIDALRERNGGTVTLAQILAMNSPPERSVPEKTGTGMTAKTKKRAKATHKKKAANVKAERFKR